MWIRTGQELINLDKIISIKLCNSTVRIYYSNEIYFTMTPEDLCIEDLYNILWDDIKSNKTYSDYRCYIEE